MASAEPSVKKEYWGPVKRQNQIDKQPNSGQAANRNGKKQENQKKKENHESY